MAIVITALVLSRPRPRPQSSTPCLHRPCPSSRSHLLPPSPPPLQPQPAWSDPSSHSPPTTPSKLKPSTSWGLLDGNLVTRTKSGLLRVLDLERFDLARLGSIVVLPKMDIMKMMGPGALPMDIMKMDPGTLTLLGAAGGVMLSMHFTMQLLSQHLFYWKNPKEQKAIIIIVLMAPLYAINSFVGLLDIQGSKAFFTFLDSVKECYEALVIAKFMALMYSYLNISLTKNIVPDEIKGREIHHSFPVSLFMPRRIRVENHTLKLLKYWTWQFVIVRPVCSVLMIVLQLLGLYPSWISWTFAIILNISVSMALYALVIFYHVFAKELAPHKPLSKFLCIKGIVFFCFWQGLALDVLAAAGVIRSHHFWLDVEHIQEALQNVLVILEMVVFSVIQQYAYHVAPYKGDGGKVDDKKNK